MTFDHCAQVAAARRRCEINAPVHVGRPLNLRPRNQRGKYRFFPGWFWGWS